MCDAALCDRSATGWRTCDVGALEHRQTGTGHVHCLSPATPKSMTQCLGVEPRGTIGAACRRASFLSLKFDYVYDFLFSRFYPRQQRDKQGASPLPRGPGCGVWPVGPPGGTRAADLPSRKSRILGLRLAWCSGRAWVGGHARGESAVSARTLPLTLTTSVRSTIVHRHSHVS